MRRLPGCQHQLRPRGRGGQGAAAAWLSALAAQRGMQRHHSPRRGSAAARFGVPRSSGTTRCTAASSLRAGGRAGGGGL
jgi:hypothetical protein